MPYYLYVKTHTTTGLKYLGKTKQKDFHKYPGSGKYWRAHLRKHGHNYTTEILLETDDKVELQEKGIFYSNLWNVVESAAWANLMIEQGDGGDTSHTDNYKTGLTRRDLSGKKNPMYGRSAVRENNLKWYNDGSKNIYVSENTQPNGFVPGRANLTRSPITNETRKKISEAKTGRAVPSLRKKVISPGGEKFDSIGLAAASLGLTVSQFRHRCVKNGKWVIE